MSQVFELGIRVLQLLLNLLLILLISPQNFILLVPFVPLSGSSNGLHPLCIVLEVSHLLILSDSLHNVVAWLEDGVGLLVGFLHF